MPRLEDLLKSKGYTETELTALAPMLTDAKFRSTLEGSLTELEGERDKFKGESEGWSSWYQETGLPTVDKALKDAQDARALAAAHEARLQTLQDQGLIKIADGNGEPKPAPGSDAPAPFDPKAHNLVTMDDVAKFADAEGDAIAVAQDLAAEYQELFGKSIFGYQGQDGARGFRALRREAVAAKRPINQYVAEKFGFAAKRSEQETAAAKAHDDAIRAETRTATIAEIANPNARPPVSSKAPMLPRPAAESKPPWEVAEGQASSVRVQKALTHILQ